MTINWETNESEFVINPATPLSQRTALESVSASLALREGYALFLTSGTTAVQRGLPKWVAIRKQAFLAGAQVSNSHLESNHSDIWLHVLPEFHVGGAAIRARAYMSGARVERPAFARKWDPARFRLSVLELEATLTSLVPAQVHDLVRLGLRSPPSLRAILVGGGALALTLYQQARELGWKLLPTYGMTEASSQVATATMASLLVNPSEYPALQVLSHLEARSNAQGQLEIRGSSLLEAYVILKAGQWVWTDPKQGGWFTTEDLGSIETGCIRLGGRLADRIKIGGESVDLYRLRKVLEEEMIQLRISQDLALVPIADPRLENVIELLRTESGESDAVIQLIERFNERVFPFEKIRSVRQIKKIPRTELGKLKPSAAGYKL